MLGVNGRFLHVFAGIIRKKAENQVKKRLNPHKICIKMQKYS